MFTNALLRCPDLTALIRDTEVHERALFSLAPPEDLDVSDPAKATADRRKTVHGTSRKSIMPRRQPRKNSAVATVLGGDLADRIKRERARDGQPLRHAADRQDDIDVELLLRGAEKLCRVYPVSGAFEKIESLRTRNLNAVSSIEEYEELAVEQIAQLNRLNRSTSFKNDDEFASLQPSEGADELSDDLPVTEDEMRREEAAIAELERKKKTLEERVNGMEKDLGGLMR